MRTWRLLDTAALAGSLNMAIDQAILAMHIEGRAPPTLRIYQWYPPAISLGYFQRRHGIDLAACRRLSINVVRRPTGGRAVLHFGDLTYAVVAGTADGIPSSVITSYRLICQGLLAAFRVLGFEAELGRQGAKSLRSDLCAFTRTAGDILHQGRKFVGSAQTWHGSSMLQHGSIILNPHLEVLASLQGGGPASLSHHEEMLKRRTTSLREILGRVPTTGRVGRAIRHGMAEALGVEFVEGELSHEEWALARKIANQHVDEELCAEENYRDVNRGLRIGIVSLRGCIEGAKPLPGHQD